jgi:pyridoxal biosynthesis lyase PdxS
LNTQGVVVIDVVNVEQTHIAADAAFLAQLPFAIVEDLPEDGWITHSAESGLDDDYREHLATVKAQGFAVNDGFSNVEEAGT